MREGVGEKGGTRGACTSSDNVTPTPPPPPPPLSVLALQHHRTEAADNGGLWVAGPSPTAAPVCQPCTASCQQSCMRLCCAMTA